MPRTFVRTVAVHDEAEVGAARRALLRGSSGFVLRDDRVALSADHPASSLLSALSECGDLTCACCRANDHRARPFFRRGLIANWSAAGHAAVRYVSVGAGLLLTDCEILSGLVEAGCVIESIVVCDALYDQEDEAEAALNQFADFFAPCEVATYPSVAVYLEAASSARTGVVGDGASGANLLVACDAGTEVSRAFKRTASAVLDAGGLAFTLINGGTGGGVSMRAWQRVEGPFPAESPPWPAPQEDGVLRLAELDLRRTATSASTSATPRGSTVEPATSAPADTAALTVALFDASRSGDAAHVRRLLESGVAPLVHPATHGLSPLHAASARGHAECVALLLAHGADPVASANDQALTPLHSAAWSCHVDVCRMLVDASAPIDAADDSGCSPLHLSAKAGSVACCEVLLPADGSCDYALEAACALGSTPLRLAVEGGRRRVALWLLRRGASTESLDGLLRAELAAMGADDDDGEGHSGSSCGGEMVMATPEHEAIQLLDELPHEFALQACQMPVYMRRLLVQNTEPDLASAHGVLRALKLNAQQRVNALDTLTWPAESLVLRIHRFLDAQTCAALREAVDVKAGSADCTKEDSVDGLAEYQLDLDERDLHMMIGDAAYDQLCEMPMRFGGSDAAKLAETPAEGRTSLRLAHAFVRRYDSSTRPWFAFHCDTAALTANIALQSDALHDGGRLLALLGERVVSMEREEGEATVHPSALHHAVTRMIDGVRYSLIVFFRTQMDIDQGVGAK